MALQGKPRLKLSRRSMLRGALSLGAMGAAGSMIPSAVRAATPKERKFLVFFASGGWDATPLDPHYDVTGVDMDPLSVLGTAGNLRYTAGTDRPNMDRFFRRWGGAREHRQRCQRAQRGSRRRHALHDDRDVRFVDTGLAHDPRELRQG